MLLCVSLRVSRRAAAHLAPLVRRAATLCSLLPLLLLAVLGAQADRMYDEHAHRSSISAEELSVIAHAEDQIGESDHPTTIDGMTLPSSLVDVWRRASVAADELIVKVPFRPHLAHVWRASVWAHSCMLRARVACSCMLIQRPALLM